MWHYTMWNYTVGVAFMKEVSNSDPSLRLRLGLLHTSREPDRRPQVSQNSSVPPEVKRGSLRSRCRDPVPERDRAPTYISCRCHSCPQWYGSHNKDTQLVEPFHAPSKSLKLTAKVLGPLQGSPRPNEESFDCTSFWPGHHLHRKLTGPKVHKDFFNQDLTSAGVYQSRSIHTPATRSS